MTVTALPTLGRPMTAGVPSGRLHRGRGAFLYVDEDGGWRSVGNAEVRDELDARRGRPGDRGGIAVEAWSVTADA